MFSTSLEFENTNPKSMDSSNGRTRRARTSVNTYNVKVLAGTALHTPRKYSKEPTVIEARRGTVSDDTSVRFEEDHDSDATIECRIEAMGTRENVSYLCLVFVGLCSLHFSQISGKGIATGMLPEPLRTDKKLLKQVSCDAPRFEYKYILILTLR
jgi:hypothetical protein